MAKGKFPAFQFYPDAWLSSTDVSLMTPAEEGAYLRLLCHAWQSDDCGLPDDDEALASLSRLGKLWKGKSGNRLRRKFEKVGARLFNPRLVEERQKQIEWRSKSSQGGRKTALAKAITINKEVQPPLNHTPTTLEPPLKNGASLVEFILQPNGHISSSSSSSLKDEEEVTMPRLTDFPKTDAAVRRRCPSADLPIVVRITKAAMQAYCSVDNPRTPSPTDADIADAVDKAAEDSPHQKGAGLFLKTVPAVVKSWAELGRHPPTVPQGTLYRDWDPSAL